MKTNCFFRRTGECSLSYPDDACIDACVNYTPRQPVEVWSRVMGYHRPVDQWNTGKQQEYADRKLFVEGAK